ncbi:MAG TPA: bifunctional DNA-formamidopyrimidine glycosylase/DNA-(apurinic or apyrimidinic site) lyase [Phycicoccus elongatus]|jgi:formamidopyrimidine-DNA glycosylase|uniref:bifunctional DNA-formamidopyrimidine glycosylase/DNA-(apurinic or apyrimidinic site) lyase n=1 Tax=Phycicoccus TaxID=367298 RepID=UPI001D500DD9|nr:MULTISPECIES: bifunctional DNA-formamidopyrimidine glycosylase/DNA-(apurinic or apyrimidinic site) lyase [Phycicoccus]MBK8730252.1 bifunctional DNA-formamidopyrimidine glycosylase/DNA-(apurinic or apyrimidinic site) lyase [Tetrasphaera sp.]MCB1238358.1 bifunctional DNA-formamidopyrimidine glycosylase/DNA-(apurinic or apyrimidinic site) lyase [Tetrasphaera sp.]MCB9405968.1 bifunctional DNA-formamidopyrimidine glycosylase/DNA-(apurinic or apyrimidinic site) lyase [Tetrasphaera sp.]MCO5303610.1
MPELPEVEVVRRGLADHVAGRRIASVELRGTRVARRHVAGHEDLIGLLTGRVIGRARRRGKYLWLELADAADGPVEDALLLHLGMSGQLLVEVAAAPDEKHLHARFRFDDSGPELRFVDQRTFGGLAWSATGADGIPLTIAHIAPDPFEPAYDPNAVVRRIKAKDSEIKRVLLDQTVVSGIGNIYADEALWRAQVHGRRMASTLTKPSIARVLGHARDVMTEALGEGGTSFDALYVNVNGASGYFDRSLAAYGQVGRPCRRCGTLIMREHFMNRSSFFCPRCQVAPRRPR